MLCYAMLCYAMLCYAMLYYAMLGFCRVMLLCIMSCLVMSKCNIAAVYCLVPFFTVWCCAVCKPSHLAEDLDSEPGPVVISEIEALLQATSKTIEWVTETVHMLRVLT